MMVTFMEVKGHQRSSEVNYVLGLPYLVKIWSKESLMQVKNDVTFMEVKGHQRSSEVNYVLGLPYLVKRITDTS